MTTPNADDLTPEPANPQGAAASTPDQPGAGSAAVDEGLPEWEPLTPELVEDEAIRGDFVMRWAVAGLALLLGCTAIAESKTLVHIRSGQYLAEHGLLPPAHDYFAFTRENQPWINLSWLFDLFSAGVYQFGGGIGLSVVQGLLAALTFGLLVHTSRPEIRTWWGSICAAFALLACWQQFTIQPELITLLGTSVTLCLLIRGFEGAGKSSAWALAGVIWLWSQLDPRAFLGWGLLVFYGAGEFLGVACGRPGFRDSADRRRFWLVAGATFLVVGLHPFLGQPWTAPWRLYFVEYPAWRVAYTDATRAELLFHPTTKLEFWTDPQRWADLRYWHGLTIENLAAIYLVLAAIVALALNRRRTPFAHVLVFLGANAAALAAGHELAFSSLVNCVLATLNAQDWYVATFGQRYSTHWNLLLFSRGGRAVTVLGLAVVGFLAISGRIDGPDGKRTGLGFEPGLAGQMAGYEQALVDSYDNRPFSFVIRQGDLLIWARQKSFIDSRLELFQQGSNVDLIDLHHKTRLALRRRSPDLPGSGDRPFWKKVLDDYQVTHVAARLRGLSLPPNYRTFDDLSRSSDWKLTALTSPVAVFYRADLAKDDSLKSYVNQHRFNSTEHAFRREVSRPVETQDWPVPVSGYQQLLSTPRHDLPDATTEAGNYLHYAAKENLRNSDRLGAAYAAVRSARAGLRANPNHAEGYLALGSAYGLIDQLETLELQRHGTSTLDRLRYYQSISACQSALVLEPNHPLPHQELVSLYLRTQRWEQAQKHLTELLKLNEAGLTTGGADAAQRLQQLEEMNQQLSRRVAAVQEQIHQQLSAGTDRAQIAVFAEQNGAVLTAIELVDANRVALVQDPRLQLLFSGWLLEAGRGEEAGELLASLERVPGMNQQSIWRDYSVYAAWARGDYPRVIELSSGTIDSAERRRVEALLLSGPFSASLPAVTTGDRYPWTHVLAAHDVSSRRLVEVGGELLHLALCQVEQGDLSASKATLQQALEEVPETPLRPLLVLYWYCLTNETLDIEPPQDWMPSPEDLISEEPDR